MPSRRRWLVLASGLALACSSSDGGPTTPTEGMLEVIAATTGSDLDPDGYSFSVDDGPARPLPSNGTDTVASLSAGDHTIVLEGIASNCVLGGDNPRSVDIAAGGTTSLQLDVACSQTSPAAGSVQVHASTGGEDPDPDGYQVALDGGTSKPLPINGATLFTDVMPGDHTIALSDVAGNCDVTGANPVTVGVSSGATTNLNITVTCSAVPPTPPGHDMALAWPDDVFLLSADGGTLTNLTHNPAGELSRDPSWSPDGQRIVFKTIHHGPGSISGQIFVMNADGSGKTPITNLDGRYYGDPRWSPDGSRIAMSSSPADGDMEVWVMKPDGSGMTQLTHVGFAVGPAWSPDGARITFTAHGANGGDFDIYVMQADGSDVRPLTTHPASDDGAAWSPDGTKIAFTSARNGTNQVYVMNSDGTGVTQLTFGSDPNDGPAWSPDGHKIAFVSWRDGGASRLFMMNPDGSERVPLTPPDFASISVPAWRP